MPDQCRSCGNTSFHEVIDLGSLPIAHKPLASIDAPEQRYPMALHCCTECGLIQILKPVSPALLYLDYNFCFSSWKAQPHIIDEIAMLAEVAPGFPVFEIGCNDGLFLEALAANGFKKGDGLEPNPHAARHAADKGFNVLVSGLDPDLCRKIVADKKQYAIVAARQVIEHLTDLAGFFEAVDILLAEDGYLLVEFPDFEIAQRIGEISMIWEEHVNYFTKAVAVSMLARHGYEVVNAKHFDFAGGSLALLAQRNPAATVLASPFDPKDIDSFSQRVRKYQNKLKNFLTAAKTHGYTIFLYGAGCRACTFVNGLNIGNLLDFTIDDQRERQGLYLPGSRLPIFPFEKLVGNDDPALCLLAVNRENEPAIQQRLRTLSRASLPTLSIFAPADIGEELHLLETKLAIGGSMV